MKRKTAIISCLMFLSAYSAEAEDLMPMLKEGVIDTTQHETLGLGRSDAIRTVTIFRAAKGSDHYANGVVITAFKDALYCMWQSSPKDEDSDDTWVTYSRSTDGETWSQMQAVRMSDGSEMDGVLEQDPYPLPDGRIVGAVHFQPGLHVCPVYTDDSSGRSG